MTRGARLRRPALLAALVLLAACAAQAAARDGSQPAPRRVAFATSDGGEVVADLWEARARRARAVVLAPGGRFTRASWAAQARVLADSGFRVLALDLRGRGESRAGSAGPDGQPLDVLAAVRWLRSSGSPHVAVVGASLGGWAAGEAAAAAPGEVDRLVLLAHAALDHPERLRVPTLFLVARGDTTAAGVPRLVAIRAQHDRAAGPRELVVVEESAHAQLLFATPAGDAVLRAIVRFLRAP